MEILNIVTEFISKVGFPVFVATYVLMRLEPAIKDLSSSIRLIAILEAMRQGTTVEELENKFGNGRKTKGA